MPPVSPLGYQIGDCFSNFCVQAKHVCILSRFSHVWLFTTPWTEACQAPLSLRILQARTLEWFAIPFTRGSSRPRDRTPYLLSPALAGDSLPQAPPVIAVVQSLSHVRLWDPMDCSTPVFPVLHHLQELAQANVHWVSDAIQPYHPLSSPFPPAFNLSQHQGVFQWVGSLHLMAKVLELQHQSFQWGLISFRVDWVDLLAVQGTLKSLLQHHSSKASILQCSAFFMVQLSRPYMTTGKIIALTLEAHKSCGNLVKMQILLQ